MITRFGRELFKGPRLKLNRGHRHISELESEVASYLGNDPYAAFKCRDRNTGQYGIEFAWSDPLPDDLSLIFGDAVHNFRTALDVLANDLVAFSGTNPEEVYFPFANSREGFERELNRKMRGATPEILNVVASLKPFPEGNVPLRAVHDLDIMDKHIDLIQAAGTAATPPFPMRIFRDKAAGVWDGAAVFEALETVETDLSRYQFTNDPNTSIVGKIYGCPVDVVIAASLPLGGIPAVVALKQVGGLVESIVQTLETLCLESS